MLQGAAELFGERLVDGEVLACVGGYRSMADGELTSHVVAYRLRYAFNATTGRQKVGEARNQPLRAFTSLPYSLQVALVAFNS